MKYCSKCGAELFDEAVICPKCGSDVENHNSDQKPLTKFCERCGTQININASICPNCGCETKSKTSASSNQGLDVAIKVLMILSCIISAFSIIPLAWMIPMTVVACNKMKNKEPIGVGFKVCTLLFVSTIAGILLLVRKED